MNLWLILYTTLLFVLLVPGVLFRVPSSYVGESKVGVVLVHAALFAVVWGLSHSFIDDLTSSWKGADVKNPIYV